VSTQGCHSRSIRDTALFFDACRGAAPGEFMPFWSPPEPYAALVQRDPGRLRIAVSHEWGDYKATPHIAAELERAGRFLEGLGHHVEWKVPAVDFRAGYAAQTTCYITNIAQNVARLSALRGHASPPRELIESMNWRIWEYGRDLTYTARADMQAGFNSTSRAFGRFFTDWDVILTPISTQTTHRRGTMDFLTLNDSDSPLAWFEKLWGMYAYTPLANLTGTPGLSLPMAQHENGLPLGIQALAAQGNDGLLLQLGAQIERALGGKWNGGRVPGVHVTA
jgi:amidase